MKNMTRLLMVFLFVGVCALVVTPSNADAQEVDIEEVCGLAEFEIIYCGHNEDKIRVCHIRPRGRWGEREICIHPESVEDHLDHGDFCGWCT